MKIVKGRGKCPFFNLSILLKLSFKKKATVTVKSTEEMFCQVDIEV